MDTLREKLRVLLGREGSPCLSIIDSRSAKTTQHVDKERGIDRNKKIKGRKDQVVVDTMGLPMAVYVLEASIHDSKGAESALEKLAHKFPRLKKILADGGNKRDELKEIPRKMLGCQFNVVLRPDESPKKFSVIP